MRVVGFYSDLVSAYDSVAGQLVPRELGAVGYGDQVVTAIGLLARVNRYGVGGLESVSTSTLEVGVSRDTPLEVLLLSADTMVFCRRCLRKTPAGLSKGQLFTPPFWQCAGAVRVNDWVCLPHYGTLAPATDRYGVSYAEFSPALRSYTDDPAFLRTGRRPWVLKEDSQVAGVDRVGLWMPVLHKRVGNRKLRAVSMGLSTVGSVVVNALGVRAGFALEAVHRDA